jgi:hypothetical protein
MRYVVAGLIVLTLAGCGRAPESSTDTGPSDNLTSAPGVAFNYSYTFRLPSTRIADAQDRHSQACERLGPARCRITGMSYDVDDAGAVSAGLQMALATPIARSFAREGVKAIETAGGSLVGATITGTEAALTEVEQIDAASGADAATVANDLERPGLSPAERAELLRQRALATAERRAAASAVRSERARVAEAPVAFTYQAGRGVGASARLADAGQTALASFVTTLSVALTVIAAVGPPAILLLLLLLLWRRVLRRFWVRLVADRSADATVT